MKENNIILEKTFTLGLRAIKLFKHLRENKVERDLCLQVLRSGTSVGANVEEAIGGSSKKGFIHKLEISYREQEKRGIGFGFSKNRIYWTRLSQIRL
jgi:hypothetical protein